MSQELAYVILTPYTLFKSRTGGIIARLITRTGLELVGARMFAPSPELVKQEEKKRLRLQAAELEQQQKLWRWLIVTALLVLVLETWLAGWLTRRNLAPAVPAA